LLVAGVSVLHSHRYSEHSFTQRHVHTSYRWENPLWTGIETWSRNITGPVVDRQQIKPKISRNFSQIIDTDTKI